MDPGLRRGDEESLVLQCLHPEVRVQRAPKGEGDVSR